MSEQADYQRKLAEAMIDAHERLPTRTAQGSDRPHAIDHIAAVLASWGVVDPAKVERLKVEVVACKEAIAIDSSEMEAVVVQDNTRLRAKVERLEAALRTIRPAGAGGPSNGLLHGDWQMIKGALGQEKNPHVTATERAMMDPVLRKRFEQAEPPMPEADPLRHTVTPKPKRLGPGFKPGHTVRSPPKYPLESPGETDPRPRKPPQ